MKNIIGIIISLVYIGLVLVAGKFFEKAGKKLLTDGERLKNELTGLQNIMQL